MPGSGRSPVDGLCRLYALMTLAYPSPFRARFAREMRLAFRSQALAVFATASGRGLLRLALRTLADWMFSLCTEYAAMPKQLLAAALVLTLLATDWLAFHDWRETHTVRDYLTLLASLLVFGYLAWDVRRGRAAKPPVH